MIDIKNLNIWKPEVAAKGSNDAFMDAEITELNLGVRSYNCLKRAGCNTIRDVFKYMGEDGQGLRQIRNLGIRSENEIMEKIKEIEEAYAKMNPASSGQTKRTIIKPAKKICVVQTLYDIISEVEKTDSPPIKDSENCMLAGRYNNTYFKFYFSPSGLPLSVLIPDDSFEIQFNNLTIMNN